MDLPLLDRLRRAARGFLRARLAAVARPIAERLRLGRYRRRLRRGQAAGELVYAWRDWQPPAAWSVEARFPAEGEGAVEAADAVRWCRRQTLRELQAVGLDRGGGERWRTDRHGPVRRDPGAPQAPWLCAPGGLVELPPAHLETCLLVAAAEEVDAVVLSPAPLSPTAGDRGEAEAATAVHDRRRHALFLAGSYAYDPAQDRVRPARDDLLVKLLDRDATAELAREARFFHATRRGPYLASRPLGPALVVGVRDAALLRRDAAPSDKPVLLVLTSFLARGGAEHTLFETLKVLRDRFELAIACLAPHHPERGDRRDDFRTLTPRVYCLGDHVHPAAMLGILGNLLDALGASTLYNANGTTLFYDFAPRLKAERPGLRIVDHLYDHRVGYVERYGEDLLPVIDACVAENRRIAEVLAGDRGWPRRRAPVVRPCGRPRSAFPTGEAAAATRRRLRREMGLADEDLVVLTAARMHPQKRPLDLVRLAERVRDRSDVHFLIAGGGELEGEVDAAIAASTRSPGARIRRLGMRTDVPDLIVAADVGCLVSQYEGLPVFLLECLQAGRPFLGTDVGEMGHVLRESGAGLVVDRPGDLEALEGQLRRLMEPELWAELADRAAEAGRGYEVEACAERYAAVFLGEEA